MLALLFDMNKLWEEYVTITLKEELKNSNIAVIVQDNKPLWGENSLRPDIVIKNGKETLIIDTKWKIPENSSASNHDLRQMYTYNRFWSASRAVLLYPGEAKSTEDLPFLNQNDSMKHSCKMAFVNVLDKNCNLDLEFSEKLLDLFNLEYNENLITH
jgi:5-methylcytosine-specific restriction enzyme subunit McrC